LFFPESDPVTGTLLAFGTYALGFVARPLGGDGVGRKRRLVVALMMIGAATFAIGLLPTYCSPEVR
jgi:MFS family permease